MKPINAFLVILLVFVFARNMVNQARAESLELFVDDAPRSERNSVWKGDGSLVIKTMLKTQDMPSRMVK